MLTKNSTLSNGSLFTYLPATVTVNGLENEMSSYCHFKVKNGGEGRKQGLPLLETPPFLTAKRAKSANFILLTV